MLMSQDIVKELVFLSHSFLMGVIITLVYDGFLIMRKLVKHNMFAISLEDLLFWIFCAISVFGMLYEENNGTLRWFAVGGAFLGMLIYKKTVSNLIINVILGILEKISSVLSRIFRILVKPLKHLAGHGKKGCERAAGKRNELIKYTKNKLTSCKKILKIILCKR